jgi:hypothetical protein
LSNFGTTLQVGKGMFLWMDRGRENPDCKHPAESMEMGAGQGYNDFWLSILQWVPFNAFLSMQPLCKMEKT